MYLDVQMPFTFHLSQVSVILELPTSVSAVALQSEWLPHVHQDPSIGSYLPIRQGSEHLLQVWSKCLANIFKLHKLTGAFCSIVIVPAPGIVTKEWAHGSADISSTWLQSLVNDFAQDFTPGATIFEHHYDDGTESSLAEHLTREGTEFLRSLRIHCVETEMGLNKRPLVLICHGTGGLVVKRVGLRVTPYQTLSVNLIVFQY